MNRRDFENEINGSKTDPGRMSLYYQFAGPKRTRRGGEALIADAEQRGATAEFLSASGPRYGSVPEADIHPRQVRCAVLLLCGMMHVYACWTSGTYCLCEGGYVCWLSTCEGFISLTLTRVVVQSTCLLHRSLNSSLLPLHTLRFSFLSLSLAVCEEQPRPSVIYRQLSAPNSADADSF